MSRHVPVSPSEVQVSRRRQRGDFALNRHAVSTVHPAATATMH